MKFPDTFPRNFRRQKFYVFLLLSAALISSASHAFAKGGKTPTATRPVARLISTSEQVAVNRPQPRIAPTHMRQTASKELSYAFSSSAPSSSLTTVAPKATSDELRAFELVNAERRAKGSRPLAWDGDLMRLARLHAGNMARQGFFDHIGPDGRSAVQRADALGIRGWRALGENIAYNQGYNDPAAFAVERWLQSSMHRDNMLKASFTHTGLGVARAADGRVFFTQVFVMR